MDDGFMIFNYVLCVNEMIFSAVPLPIKFVRDFLWPEALLKLFVALKIFIVWSDLFKFFFRG